MTGRGAGFRPFDLPQLPTLQEARERWLGYIPPRRPDAEAVPVPGARGRVLAEDVRAAAPIPGFDRSLVDGVALRAADTVGATRDAGRPVRVRARVRMGEAPAAGLGPGEGALVPTGGMLPPGADAVVMVEEFPELLSPGQPGGEVQLVVRRTVAPGENVVPRGADVGEGALVLRAGHRLRPQDIGVLAGLGRTSIQVYRRPRVAILSTGTELVPPDQAPLPGQIRDMNGWSLAALVEECGGVPWNMGIVPDQRDKIKGAIAEGLQADMLVISGGSSVGEEDWTPRLLEEMGPPGIVVHGVKLAPGKPTLCAVVRGKPVVGLPGNPVSALVVFRLFGVPVLRRLAGEADAPGWYPVVRARLGGDVAGPKGRELHQRVVLVRAGDGTWVAQPLRGGSHQLMTMVEADGLITVPADHVLPAGTWVEVTPWISYP